MSHHITNYPIISLISQLPLQTSRYLNAALGIQSTANLNLRVMSVKVLGECAEWVTVDQQVLNHVLQKLLQGQSRSSGYSTYRSSYENYNAMKLFRLIVQSFEEFAFQKC